MSCITNGTDFIIACENGLQCADTCIEINIWRLFQASRYGPSGLLLQNILPVRRMVIPRVGFRFRMGGYDEMTEPGKPMGRRGPTALLAGGLDALHASGVGMLSRGVGVLSFQFRPDHLYQRRSFQKQGCRGYGSSVSPRALCTMPSTKLQNCTS